MNDKPRGRIASKPIVSDAQLRNFDGAPLEGMWFEILGIIFPKKACWLEIHYSSSFLSRPDRPLLRMVGDQFVDDEILPAPLFGQAFGLVYLGATTHQLFILPSQAPTRGGFRIDRLNFVKPNRMIARALLKNPAKAAAAIAAKLAGLDYLSQVALRHALRPTPVSDYSAWRQNRQRPMELDGLDEFKRGEFPNIHILVDPNCNDAEWLKQSVSRWRQESSNLSFFYLNCSQFQLIDAVPGPRLRQLNQLHDICAESAASDSDLVFMLGLKAHLADYTILVVAAEAARHPDAVLFYGDEEKNSSASSDNVPILRSEFDPILFETLDSLGDAIFLRMGFLRLSIVRGDSDFTGSWIPKVLAKAVGKLGTTRHIPRVLQSQPKKTRPLMPLPTLRVPNHEIANVTIVIPTRDQPQLLASCVKSVEQTTTGLKLNFLIVDNGSIQLATGKFLQELAERPNFSVLFRPGPFNFSALCNEALEHAETSLLLFLNDDTEALTSGWLQPMIELAGRNNVGAVGPRLLYADGRLQHGGVVLGIDGRAGHFERLTDGASTGFFRRLQTSHRVGAVTGACFLVEAFKFRSVGGFDATHLPVDLNDVDLCLRLREKGWHSVLCGGSSLLHHESKSRGGSWHPEKVHGAARHYFKQRWLYDIANDRHFHPALSRDGTNAALD